MDKKYIFIPLLCVAVLFLLDKLFLLPEVRDNFLQPGGSVYYRQRAKMLERLPQILKENQNRKATIVLGDSRSFGIGTAMLDETGAQNDWFIVNFSGPQALPAYHSYLVEEIFSKEMIPKYVIFAASPDSFNRNSFVFADPILNFGVDSVFANQYNSMIPKKDWEDHEKRRRWALTGINFSAKDFFKRVIGSLTGSSSNFEVSQINPRSPMFAQVLEKANNPNLSLYSLESSPERMILDLGYGSQYAWFGKAKDADLFEDTERLKGLYLKHFVVSEEQMFFYEKVLRRLKERNVKTVVFWPRVNPYLLEAARAEPKMQQLWLRLQSIAAQHGAVAVDLNELNDCKDYYDASHLSITCFPKITRQLVTILQGIR